MSVGAEIKKARIDKGLKQKDLVATTGISQKYISFLETDKLDPPLSIMQTMATLLGLRLDTLPPVARPNRRAGRPRERRARPRPTVAAQD
jgi:transcriptional regulator with XRE-family HTH domain